MTPILSVSTSGWPRADHNLVTKVSLNRICGLMSLMAEISRDTAPRGPTAHTYKELVWNPFKVQSPGNETFKVKINTSQRKRTSPILCSLIFAFFHPQVSFGLSSHGTGSNSSASLKQKLWAKYFSCFLAADCSSAPHSCQPALVNV